MQGSIFFRQFSTTKVNFFHNKVLQATVGEVMSLTGVNILILMMEGIRPLASSDASREKLSLIDYQNRIS